MITTRALFGILAIGPVDASPSTIYCHIKPQNINLFRNNNVQTRTPPRGSQYSVWRAVHNDADSLVEMGNTERRAAVEFFKIGDDVGSPCLHHAAAYLGRNACVVGQTAILGEAADTDE